MAVIEFQMLRSNDANQPYYWRIVSTGNRNILATSETYARKVDAEAAINLVYSNAASASYDDRT